MIEDTMPAMKCMMPPGITVKGYVSRSCEKGFIPPQEAVMSHWRAARSSTAVGSVVEHDPSATGLRS